MTKGGLDPSSFNRYDMLITSRTLKVLFLSFLRAVVVIIVITYTLIFKCEVCTGKYLPEVFHARRSVRKTSDKYFPGKTEQTSHYDIYYMASVLVK